MLSMVARCFVVLMINGGEDIAEVYAKKVGIVACPSHHSTVATAQPHLCSRLPHDSTIRHVN